MRAPGANGLASAGVAPSLSFHYNASRSPCVPRTTFCCKRGKERAKKRDRDFPQCLRRQPTASERADDFTIAPTAPAHQKASLTFRNRQCIAAAAQLKPLLSLRTLPYVSGGTLLRRRVAFACAPVFPAVYNRSSSEPAPAQAMLCRPLAASIDIAIDGSGNGDNGNDDSGIVY